MPAPAPELLQFPFSHFNEKVRWALDYKGIAHKRRDLLPGPHMPVVVWLTGQTEVPVLLRPNADGGGRSVLWGSAHIIDELERWHPQPSLYPADPDQAAQSMRWQTWFDEQAGPLIRRSLFARMIETPTYLTGMFSSTQSAAVRWIYGAVFPMVRPVMKKSMGIADAASVREADTITREALDRVAEATSDKEYLVGDHFSIADLTAASLLAPVANPPDSPMRRPEPVPASLVEWNDRWRDHPGVAWVRAVYRRHRPPFAELVP